MCALNCWSSHLKGDFWDDFWGKLLQVLRDRVSRNPAHSFIVNASLPPDITIFWLLPAEIRSGRTVAGPAAEVSSLAEIQLSRETAAAIICAI